MQKSDTAWKTGARMAALAEETDDDYEREHFTRLRDAWITLANRCEPFDFPDSFRRALPASMIRRLPPIRRHQRLPLHRPRLGLACWRPRPRPTKTANLLL